MDTSEGLRYKFTNQENSGQRRSGRLQGINARFPDDPNNLALPRAKIKKKPSRRKAKASPRKNRPHPRCRNMSLDCCVEKTCLLNQGYGIIELIRADFDKKLYEEQNNFLSSFIDVELRPRRSKITYSVRDVSGIRKVQICRTAFLKIFGISTKRIDVLLRKKKRAF